LQEDSERQKRQEGQKGVGTPENREAAYTVYALFGGRNIKQILGRLEWKHGLRISAQTLYEWKKEGKWDARIAVGGEQDVLTFNERMLKRVLRLIGMYDRHFASGDSAKDAQAAYAYTNLIRTAMELKRRMNRWESECPPDIVRRGTEAGESGASAQPPGEEEEGPRHMAELEDGVLFRKAPQRQGHGP
jgi:hypothetical protein